MSSESVEDVYDPGPDVVALLRAQLRGDDEGARAILDNANLREIVSTLCEIVITLLMERAQRMLEAGGVSGATEIREVVDRALLDELRREQPGGSETGDEGRPQQ